MVPGLEAAVNQDLELEENQGASKHAQDTKPKKPGAQR
jgi:hypothetical protein